MHLVHAPIPDLHIVSVDCLLPHEENDSQRSLPLVESLRQSKYLVNPPVIAPINNDEYVILDGANRSFAFESLNYPHILAQVVSYESSYVELDVWHHIVSRWNIEAFKDQVEALEGVTLAEGHNDDAIAHIVLPEGEEFAVQADVNNLYERNRILRQVVRLYQTQAILDRTAISKPHEVLPLYSEAIALVVFPNYQPEDIVAAAKEKAYLPPGISRHVVHGRAIRVNFPMEVLRDGTATLEDKNEALSEWMERKFANRQVRYYAEATYQFDE
jgi:L-serine kinase (ATP) / ParB family transcriptional regulator, heme-responsive regulator